MANITLPTSSSTFDSLQTKYSNFYAPACEILINGANVLSNEMALTGLWVNSSVESRADAFGFTIANAFDIGNRTFSWLEDSFMPGTEVEIKLGYTSTLVSMLGGIITKVSARFHPNEQPVLEVEGMDKQFKMMKGTVQKTFLQQAHSAIVTTKQGEHGFSAGAVDTTTPTLEVETQNNESDFEYIARLAKQYNYEFFVLGDKLYFRKPHPSTTEIVTLEWGTTLFSLDISADIGGVEATKVEVHGYDKKTKTEIVGEAATVTSFGSGAKSGCDLLKTALGNKDAIKLINDPRIAVAADAKAFAQAVLDEIALKFIYGEGTCVGIPELRAGICIKLDKVGKFTNTYYVTQATHSFDRDGYITKFTVGGVKL